MEVKRKQKTGNLEEKNQKDVSNVPDCDPEVLLTFTAPRGHSL